MDRVIKFRGFIKDENKMVYPNSDNDYCLLGSNSGGYDLVKGYDTFGVDAILMQFTGLTDRNGVEIYEGDIIRIFNDEDDSWDDEVSFHMGCFFSGDEDLLSNVHFRAEVIGNLYENKDDTNEISKDEIELIALYFDYHTTKHNLQFAEAIDRRTGRVAITNNSLVSVKYITDTRKKLKPLFKEKIHEFNQAYKKYNDMRYYDVKELFESHQQRGDFDFIEKV